MVLSVKQYPTVVQEYSTATLPQDETPGCNSLLSLNNFYCLCYFVQIHVLPGSKSWLLKNPDSFLTVIHFHLLSQTKPYGINVRREMCTKDATTFMIKE